jgi:3-oxoacyl-[acyl-carrier protein] reductase
MDLMNLSSARAASTNAHFEVRSSPRAKWQDKGGLATKALPGNAFYAATEAEVVFWRGAFFAMELGPHGITVNAVAPGFVRTDMTQGGRGAADSQGTEERLGARAMMGRIGEPEDIANAVVFLVSPESGWITAQMLTVDGGRMDYIGHG